MKRVWIFLVLGWLHGVGFAEPLPLDGSRLFQFGQYSTRNGLAASFVYATAQDSKGFIWIATHDGLNRFDGYQFTTWRSQPGKSGGLPGNTIAGLHIDTRGRIWLIIRDSLWRFDPLNGQCRKTALPCALINFKGFYHLDSATILVDAAQDILLLPDRDSAVAWAAHPASLGVPNPAHKMEFSVSRAGECFAAQLRANMLQIWRYDPQRKQFTPYSRVTMNKADQELTSFLVDRSGQVHVSIQGYGPLRYAPEKTRNLLIRPGNRDIVHFWEDTKGNVWMSTPVGLALWDRQQETEWLMRAVDAPGALRSDVVRQVREDRSGLLWIATGNGVHTLNPRQRQVSHLSADAPLSHRLLQDFVLGLRSDTSGRLWIQYFIQDQQSSFRDDGPIRHFLPPTGLNDIVSMKGETVYRPNPAMSFGLRTDNAQWWLMQGRKILRNGSDSAWYAPSPIADARRLGDSIWLATSTSGLQCFDLRGRRFITGINNRFPGIPSELNCLYHTGDTLWLGTKGEGLIAIDLRSGKLIRLSVAEGLAHPGIYSMARDHRGRLWIGTASGLSCYHPATGRFRNFHTEDGFRNEEYNRYSACLLPDGRLAFGGIRGIDIFHPDSLMYRNINFKPVLTDVQVFNQSLPVRDSLQLTHDQNSLRFAFSLLHFSQSNGQSYQYRLEGLDPEWVTIKGKNEVSYSHLPPGRYAFWLRAWQDEGSWAEPARLMTLVISPAWYQTGLFYFLSMLAAGALIYGLFVFRLRQRLRIYQVRQHIHRDLHDDVGATLSAVKAYAEILKDKPGNTQIPEMIRENASEMIDRLDEIAWATDPRHDTLSSLKNRMLKFASPLCHARGIDLVLEMDDALDTVEISGETRQHVLLIVKEAINNTMKYAESTQCRISLRQKGGWLYLRLKDNGKGSEGVVKGGGNGWQSMKNRAQEAGGHVTILSAPGQGTEIRLAVPLQFQLPNSWGRGKS